MLFQTAVARTCVPLSCSIVRSVGGTEESICVGKYSQSKRSSDELNDNMLAKVPVRTQVTADFSVFYSDNEQP